MNLLTKLNENFQNRKVQSRKYHLLRNSNSVIQWKNNR